MGEAEDGWYDRARKVIEPIGDIDVVRVVKSISKAYDTPVQEGLQRCQELALEIAADFGQDISDVSNTN